MSLEQQLEVKNVITIEKAKTIFELISDEKIFKLTNDIECSDQSFNTSTSLIVNLKLLIKLLS